MGDIPSKEHIPEPAEVKQKDITVVEKPSIQPGDPDTRVIERMTGIFKREHSSSSSSTDSDDVTEDAKIIPTIPSIVDEPSTSSSSDSDDDQETDIVKKDVEKVE